MAENKTNPEVELDTDGVNEETVTVDAPEVSTEAFEKKQEVDLGYVDVSGGKSAKELLDETKEEEKPEPKFEQKEEESEDPSLQDYSEKVQKRIKRLTFQAKEAERRERAAVEYAKGLKNQFDNSEKKFQETDTNYLKEYNARVDSERDKARSELQVALDSSDSNLIMEAQDKLTKLAVEKEKVSMTLANKESKNNEVESQPVEAQTQAPQPRISDRAQDWATDNEWFGSDRVLTSAAMGIHEDLLQEGIDAESDSYYNQINKRMKEYFPQKFAESSTEEKTKAAPVQNVASVSRRSGGRKSVKLTKSQVVIAKKLGVPLEEYAKYVKEGA
jgi:hypothetical protein|tara:strand:- start:314 stop:1306 length:993 start_codon:yes stop_codon:yes gene_type:complete